MKKRNPVAKYLWQPKFKLRVVAMKKKNIPRKRKHKKNEDH